MKTPRPVPGDALKKAIYGPNPGRDLAIMLIQHRAFANHCSDVHTVAEWLAIKAGREYSHWPRTKLPKAPRPKSVPFDVGGS